MKPRLSIKIYITAIAIILCMVVLFALYSRLGATQKAEDFDLYTLVPANVMAIVDTDNMVSLLNDVNELSCSKDGEFLYISLLFSSLKEHFNTVLQETPNGLSRQMSKMLFSFHEPDNDMNQVFYCRLGAGDYEFIEKFIRKYCAEEFPSKYFDYKGEEIRIYPMPDDNFLACYISSEFFVASYQKRLIEEVIDARLSRQSVLQDKQFREIRTLKNLNIPATVYIRMQPLDMGKSTDGIPSRTLLGGWTEFNMKTGGDAIYFSGVNYDTDSCYTFMSVLRNQIPVDDFPDSILPTTTFLFNTRSISNLQSMLNFTSSHEYAKATYSNYIMERDDEMTDFLRNHAWHSISICIFHGADDHTLPCAVMSIPVRNAVEAERQLRNLISKAPQEEGRTPPDNSVFRTSVRAYRLNVMPRSTIFTQLTGITESALYTYACFYKDKLLIAPDDQSLTSYIQFMENGETLEKVPVYKEIAAGFSPTYNFVMMADLETVMAQPENYVRLIPNFFFRNQKFFSNFMLSTQFTTSGEAIYPNITLTYKGEKQ